ncbi:MAG: PaaI family thioesterase [Burkholderiaceae bacterium]
MSTEIPAGFEPIPMRRNPFIDPLGPLYGKKEDGGLTLGIRIEERHCNPAGNCHGGMLMTLADMLLIFNCTAQTGFDSFMVTINLTCDYLGPAPIGVWLEGRAKVRRAGRNLVFVDGLFEAAGKPVARVNGIFKPTGEPIGRPS